jgi:hypothetical protein
MPKAIRRGGYRAAVLVVARALRDADLGEPTIRPSHLSDRAVDLDGGDGGYRRALAWARVMDDIPCLEVIPSGSSVYVLVTGQMAGFGVRYSTAELGSPVTVERAAEITVAELEVLAGESVPVAAEPVEVSA